MNSNTAFLNFLEEQGIKNVAKQKHVTIDELVEANFDNMNETVLRSLAQYAMKEYSSGGGGVWMGIIDSVRNITTKKRANAEQNLMSLLNYCSSLPSVASSSTAGGSKLTQDKALMIKKCKEMYASGLIDKVFMELLMNTRDACKEQALKNRTDASQDENVLQMEFYIKCFGALMLKKNASSGDSGSAGDTTSASTSSSTTPSNAKPSNSSKSLPKPVKNVDLNAIDEDDEDGDVYSDDEDLDDYWVDSEMMIDEKDLIKCGTYIQGLIKKCNGNVGKLKEDVVALFKTGTSTGGDAEPYVLNRVAFQRVIKDNIAACVTAGYVNKRKIFEFLQKTVETIIENEERLEREVSAPDGSVVTNGATTYHAPQFIENENRVRIGENGEVIPVDVVVDSPGAFVDASSTSRAMTAGLARNNKKKALKKQLKEDISKLADAVGEHLRYCGYAVCDHFLPLELVKRCRTECGLFNAQYEASEIWVGKQADVGAHLTVPSVRGDRVLWMCGAHPQDAAPEGITRHVATMGEVEPCKLSIKAVAPVRKFTALRELIHRCDSFVKQLKGKVEKIKGIYERSDLMFSIYDNGARFANHIDNTTHDGRILTVVMYLNPDWEAEGGGAIRVQVPPEYQKTKKIYDKMHAGSKNATAHSGKVAPSQWSDTQPDAASTDETSNADGHDLDQKLYVDVLPECGRIVCFYSAEIPHEVCPSFNTRHACTIWYYDKTERKEAVKRAAEAGKAAEVEVAGIEAQTEARTFIAELMGRDQSVADVESHRTADATPATIAAIVTEHSHTNTAGTGVDEIITEELLAELNDKVQNSLSAEALSIVASITGAPSPESFKEGFKLLVPEDLKNIRHLFRRMGLSD